MPAETKASGAGMPYLFPAVGPLENIVRSLKGDSATAPLWGTDYSADSDLVRVPMLVQQVPALIEHFGITASPQRGMTGDAALVTFAWEHTRASVELRKPK